MIVIQVVQKMGVAFDALAELVFFLQADKYTPYPGAVFFVRAAPFGVSAGTYVFIFSISVRTENPRPILKSANTRVVLYPMYRHPLASYAN